MKKKVLISVSDKRNLIDFAMQLTHLNYDIISTGGTLDFLKQHNIPATPISQVINFPEILDGRVKTLHPAIHAGLLSIRNNPQHQQQMIQHHLDYIDMVVVNLYPFKQTIDTPNVTFNQAIEQIDIGGPSMLRSAAKNHHDVTVIVDIDDYPKILQEIQSMGSTNLQTRQQLAAKVFAHTASYDATIAQFFHQNLHQQKAFPTTYTPTFQKIQDLRYGENPHQKAAFYSLDAKTPYALTHAQQLQGKELSYNNIQDADAALQILQEFGLEQNVCVAIKHTNPCAVATSDNVFNAWLQTFHADPVSIFGGIVAFNNTIDHDTAQQMINVFLEVIIAPDYTPQALQIFNTKKNLRILKVPMAHSSNTTPKITSVIGGILLQDPDIKKINSHDLQLVTKKSPSPSQIQDLLFAWKIVKHVKSNAIVVAHNGTTKGIGAGQTNRIGATQIALQQTPPDPSQQRVLASDAFFPFDDVVRLAHQHHIQAIIQPGGSIKDQDSINACNDLDISMLFTNTRHFKH